MGGAGIVLFIAYVCYYWIRLLKKITTRHNSIERRCVYVSSLSVYHIRSLFGSDFNLAVFVHLPSLNNVNIVS